jgi:crotonobetainyl-CoA:carnitine CoA-transferase CaiB-like acyl-CoA transferase
MTSHPAADEPRGALDGIRVLDLTDVSGALAARLLGDLGADVVRVELPGGSTVRRIGPFASGERDPEQSQTDWFYNANKRGIVLDWTMVEGRRRLRSLLERADVLIESDLPGHLATLGLGAAELCAELPRLIVTSITPFGQTGPRAGWRGSELVCAALGGIVFVNGHPEEPPLAPFGLQAYHSASAFAAIGTLCALFWRERTGLGQHVDMSIVAGAAGALEHATSIFRLQGQVEGRRGSLHWTRCFRVGRCKDGHVLHCILGDWTSLVEWVASDGKAQDLLAEPWQDSLYRREHCEHLFDVLDAWAADHSVAELMEGAQLRRLPYATVQPSHMLATDEQLRAREFFVRLEGDDRRRGSVFPGAPFLLSRTPWRLRRPAPLLAQHQDEVLHDPAWTGRAGGSPEIARCEPSPTAASVPPLGHVTILDFTWVVAGPVATRILADQGARVVKVERRDSLDFGSRRGGLAGNLNRGKQSVVIDMNDPRGIDVARRLAAVSDVVIDNFSARVMRNWGLDYSALSAIRPDIIAVGMSGFGKTGPRKDFVSYGPTLQALAGFPLQMRLEGSRPTGWGYSYADMAAGYMAAFATLAALWYRDRTGLGQEVDLGQYANLIALMGPSLFDLLRGVEVHVPGNASQEAPAAPHGIYRCAAAKRASGDVDDDRWVAIAVFGDRDWEALRNVLAGDGEDWSYSSTFAWHADRVQFAPELDRRLGEWTRRKSAEEVQDRLQSAGVAAGLVANAEDLCTTDPHLHARGYFASLVTPEGKRERFDGVPFVASRSPGRVTSPGPLLGEHTDVVLTELLGMTEAEISSLRADRVIG